MFYMTYDCMVDSCLYVSLISNIQYITSVYYCTFASLTSKRTVDPSHLKENYLFFRSGEVNSIQHYVIQFISDWRQIGGFLRVYRFPPPIKWSPRYVPEILLKVALNTITLNPYFSFVWQNIWLEGKLTLPPAQQQDHTSRFSSSFSFRSWPVMTTTTKTYICNDI